MRWQNNRVFRLFSVNLSKLRRLASLLNRLVRNFLPVMDTQDTHQDSTTDTNAVDQVAAEQNLEETTNEQAQEAGIDPLQKVQAELEEMKDKYLRLFAEFDNFKRRSARERLDYMKTAGQDVLRDLLPVLDDVDRAEKSVTSATDVEAVRQGFLLIKDKLTKNLVQKGLKPMETIGQPFDADFHEAVTEIPAPTEELKGKILDEIEKGYLLNDKIIRYAKVVVGK